MIRSSWIGVLIAASIAGLHCSHGGAASIDGTTDAATDGTSHVPADNAADTPSDSTSADRVAPTDGGGGVADPSGLDDGAGPDDVATPDDARRRDGAFDSSDGWETLADAQPPADASDVGGECPAPAVWWDDFAVPQDPRQGVEPGPPVLPVCLEPMPDTFFDGIPCPVWGPENPPGPGEPPVEAVVVWFNAESHRLFFDPIASDGFVLRSDGVGVNWYGGATDGLVIRLEFSLTRARFLHFERATGAFYGESVLVPLTGPVCLTAR